MLQPSSPKICLSSKPPSNWCQFWKLWKIKCHFRLAQMTPWYPMFFLGTMPNIFQWSNWAARPMFNFVLLRQKHAQSRQSWQTFLPKHTTEWLYPNISLNGWFYGQNVNTRTNCINTVFLKNMNETTCAKNPQTRMCCQILHRHATLQSIKWVRGDWVLACNLSKLDESSCTYLGRLCFYHNFFTRFFCESIVTWRSSDLELQTRMCAVFCKQTKRCGGWFACKFHSRCRRCKHSKSCLAMK